ncbi:hypothetical protein [Xanthobacter sp. KR7-225]|uniref:hypothetical protein n=1 Tax=Xanthobacter sp. KR7-225 TaxID=3156613 RepID=UPI0032B60AAE
MSTSRRKPRERPGAAPGGRRPSLVDPAPPADDFSQWLAEAYAQEGDFTALVVLVAIGETRVSPLASTFLTFVGDAVGWAEIAGLFAGAKKAWDGVSFFPVLDADGPLENAEARARLRRLEARIAEDRLVLNEGAFFDAWGRKLKVEQITPH